MKLEIRSEFQPINPFAEQAPFLLFYNKGTRGRIYQVNGLGCVTPHISKATRYEINTYQNELNGVVAHGLTSSRHEAQFHLPSESSGGFS